MRCQVPVRHALTTDTVGLLDCGGEISLADANNHRSAIISSPGYPMNYHDNLDCVWNITTTSDRIISYK